MKEVNKKSVLIGCKLKQLRLNRGYTQSRIAEVLGVSPQHYGTLERGINAFSLDNILKLCDFYNVTVMSILGEIRKTDRRKKKECEKLISQIEELGEEHKEVVTHMVKFYRQLERKSEKEEEISSSKKLIEQEGMESLKKPLINVKATKKKLAVEDKEDDNELSELIQTLEDDIRQKEIGGMNRISKKNKEMAKTKKTSKKGKKANS